MWKVKFTYRGVARSRSFEQWWQARKFIEAMARQGVECRAVREAVK